MVERVAVRGLRAGAELHHNVPREARKALLQGAQNIIFHRLLVGGPVRDGVVNDIGQLLNDDNLPPGRRERRIIRSRQKDLEGGGGNIFRVPRTPVVSLDFSQLFQRDVFQAKVDEKTGMGGTQAADARQIIRIQKLGADEMFERMMQIG